MISASDVLLSVFTVFVACQAFQLGKLRGRSNTLRTINDLLTTNNDDISGRDVWRYLIEEYVSDPD